MKPSTSTRWLWKSSRARTALWSVSHAGADISPISCKRAALSIVLNIAEGAGKFSPADKAVFYTRARGSTTESAAVLDVCRKLNLIPDSLVDDNKALLERVAQMLTKLLKSRRAIE